MRDPPKKAIDRRNNGCLSTTVGSGDKSCRPLCVAYYPHSHSPRIQMLFLGLDYDRLSKLLVVFVTNHGQRKTDSHSFSMARPPDRAEYTALCESQIGRASVPDND